MIQVPPYGKETMSVAELIAELQKIPDPETHPVISEGCDCDGGVVVVDLLPDGQVYLGRGEEW